MRCYENGRAAPGGDVALTVVDVPATATAALWELGREVESLVASEPGPDEVPVEQARAAHAAEASPRSERAGTEVASAAGASVPVRVFDPGDVGGVYLHIHGGGWTMGAADLQDERLEALSVALGVAVVSVDYRLAPEHRHPAGADDCEVVARWLAECGSQRFGTDRFVIGGESAGAHLSAVTVLRMRDRHGRPDLFCGANLVYGLYDLSLTPSARLRGARRLVLSTPIIEYHAGALLGPDGDPLDPDVSPLRAPLHDLPPALMTVGTDDALVDDSVFLAARWELAGSPARLDLYEGGFHAFNLFPGEVADLCDARQHEFIAACLAGSPAPA